MKSYLLPIIIITTIVLTILMTMFKYSFEYYPFKIITIIVQCKQKGHL